MNELLLAAVISLTDSEIEKCVELSLEWCKTHVEAADEPICDSRVLIEYWCDEQHANPDSHEGE